MSVALQGECEGQIPTQNAACCCNGKSKMSSRTTEQRKWQGTVEQTARPRCIVIHNMDKDTNKGNPAIMLL